MRADTSRSVGNAPVAFLRSVERGARTGAPRNPNNYLMLAHDERYTRQRVVFSAEK